MCHGRARGGGKLLVASYMSVGETAQLLTAKGTLGDFLENTINQVLSVLVG